MAIGPVLGYTANFNFTLIAYDYPRWQSYEYDNWNKLDATIAALFGGAGIAGVWKNGTAYTVSQRLIDSTNNSVYTCLVAHTSPATGTFAQARTANPSYWANPNVTPTNRGAWTTATSYSQYDYVQSGNQFAVCVIPHVSGTFATDVATGKWNVLIDLTGYNPTACLAKASNLSDLTNVSTARTNLGLGSAATLPIVGVFQPVNNLSEGTPATMRANLGLGSAALQASATFAQVNNNLSDLPNKTNARTNLGLGGIATQNNITVDQIAGAGAFGRNWLNNNTASDATKTLVAFVGDPGTSSPGNPGVIGLVPAPANGDAASAKFLSASGVWSVPAATNARTNVRQTAQTGPQNAGLPTFLPTTSGSLVLVAQGISTGINALVVSAAQGTNANGSLDYIMQFTTNPQWTCNANVTNYLYINAQTGATSVSGLVPIYQFGGAISTTNGQFTFDICTMIGYLGNGSSAVATPLVCIGEAVAGSAAITSSVAYAYNGFYDSGLTAGLANGPVTKQHNIGVPNASLVLRIQNTTAEAGYAVGDVVTNVMTSVNTTSNGPIGLWSTRLGSGFVLNSANGGYWYAHNKTTSTITVLTLASWSYGLVARRGWGGA